jgi:tRNA1(Val) A37 N6-methylase TrmN6
VTTAASLTEVTPPALTVDAFLGGQVEAVQPADGHHRSGLEAVLLAAAVDAELNGTVVDLGAGVGVAGMAVAARCSGARVVLVERDATANDCARAALARPANRSFAERVTVAETDIAMRSGVRDGMAAAVICNPPFHLTGAASASPKSARAGAHMLAEGGLEPWLRAAAALVERGGQLHVIFIADGLSDLLVAMGRRFGAADILPIHPRSGLPAHRILVRAIKGSRAPLRLLPPLVLHEASGNGFRSDVEAILRGAAGLAAAVPSWGRR